MKPSFGLYVHIPYCLKKCPYCDFNSYAVSDPNAPGAPPKLPELRYAEALAAELTRAADSAEWAGRSLHSIFFGGGTPSLLSPETYATFLDVVRSRFPLLPEAEITMETNPGTVHEALGSEKLSRIRSTGVNRVSLGVQSFSERKRQLLGRWHGTDDILQAIANITAAGFSNRSFDFIYATPDETASEWQSDLERAVSLAPQHLSAYTLTIEPGTEFGRLQKKGRFTELDEDAQAELYEQTGRFLESQGYVQYEISNYARPGAECRHNLGYWRGEDYLGIGAGAHSFFGTKDPAAPAPQRRWINLPGPEHYIAAALQTGSAVQRTETLDESQERMEFFFLRLRTAAGANRDEYRRLFGDDFEARYASVLEAFLKDGFLREEGQRFSLTRRGFLFSSSVFDAFAAHS